MKNDLKVLSLSDVHFGDKDPELLYSELKHTFISKVVELGVDLDLLVIAGDLFHKKLSLNSKASRLVIKFIDELFVLSNLNGFHIRIIQGTHSHDLDQLKNFEYMSSDKFKIIYKPQVEYILGVKLLFIPEEYPKDMVAYYKEYFNQKYDLIFLHGTFKFTAFSNQIIKSEKHIKAAPIFDEKLFRDMCDGYVICGHIHVYRNYKDFIYYGGSFSRSAHGEEEEKGFLYIEYYKESDKSFVERVINKDAPTYKTIDMSEISDKSLEEVTEFIEESKSKYDNIKLKNLDRNKISTKILQKSNSGDSNIKIETVKKKEDVERDESFDFILKSELELPQEIQKFILVMYEVDVEVDAINDFIN